MKLPEAIEALQHILQHTGTRGQDMELAVVIHQPGSIGATPSVPVESILAGFDWDSNHILLWVREPLTRLSPEDVAAINKSVRAGQSWHAHQAQKQLRDRIAELERILADIRSLG